MKLYTKYTLSDPIFDVKYESENKYIYINGIKDIICKENKDIKIKFL